MRMLSEGATVPTITPQPEKLAPLAKGAIPIKVRTSMVNPIRKGPISIYLANFIKFLRANTPSLALTKLREKARPPNS